MPAQSAAPHPLSRLVWADGWGAGLRDATGLSSPASPPVRAVLDGCDRHRPRGEAVKWRLGGERTDSWRLGATSAPGAWNGLAPGRRPRSRAEDRSGAGPRSEARGRGLGLGCRSLSHHPAMVRCGRRHPRTHDGRAGRPQAGIPASGCHQPGRFRRALRVGMPTVAAQAMGAECHCTQAPICEVRVFSGPLQDNPARGAQGVTRCPDGPRAAAAHRTDWRLCGCADPRRGGIRRPAHLGPAVGSVAEALRQFGDGYVQGLGQSARNNAPGYDHSVTATADHAMLDHLAVPPQWPRDLQWPGPAHPWLWRDRSGGGMKVDRDKALTGEFAV